MQKQSDPTWSTTGQDWTTYTYHPSGAVKSSTDPWNQVVTYAYDKNGQQTQRVARGTDNKGSRTMTWSYYPDGSLKQRTRRCLGPGRAGRRRQSRRNDRFRDLGHAGGRPAGQGRRRLPGGVLHTAVVPQVRWDSL